MGVSDALKNIGAVAGGELRFGTNKPTQYIDRQKQYYGNETATFTEKMAKYSSDFFEAQVQGLYQDDFYKWDTQYLRLADIAKSSSAITKQNDDFKNVLLASRHIDYIPRGAKIVAAGSTWLVTNPKNVSGTSGTAVVERCNAVWCHFDYYGNVLKEPLVIASGVARASSNNSQEFVLLTEGYYTAKVQLNPDTAVLGQNSRIILGTKAYAITGYTDFIQEFTGDDDSTHICEFTLRYEEPNEEIDDLENKVAGGKNFSWTITVRGTAEMPVGAEEQMAATSVRNGEAVYSNENQPISYTWQSSDENIATVDANGMVTAVSEGTCEIICTLAQNPSISNWTAIEVTEAVAGGQIRFKGYVPESLEAYETATITAACFLDGEETEEVVDWDFTGATESTYTAISNGSELTITCYGYSPTPLKITAKYGENTVVAEIKLLGV